MQEKYPFPIKTYLMLFAKCTTCTNFPKDPKLQSWNINVAQNSQAPSFSHLFKSTYNPLVMHKGSFGNLEAAFIAAAPNRLLATR